MASDAAGSWAEGGSALVVLTTGAFPRGVFTWEAYVVWVWVS